MPATKKLFKSILVGVDLNRCNPLEASALSPIAREAIERGSALAKLSSAKLLFLAALNLTEEVLQPLPEEERGEMAQGIVTAAQEVLNELAAEAKKKRIKASGQLATGKGWLAIIQEVLRGGHDLVVVGTRDATGLRRMLFGNTAMKLLRRCPCPVLVTRLSSGMGRMNILAATDLKPASQEAVRLALDLARQRRNRLYILHVIEYPLDRIWSTGYNERHATDYHRRVRAEAEATLKTQLEALGLKELGSDIELHFADGTAIPDVAIQHFIEAHNIDLLVMGTIGRGGIPGIMIGNTAERLLPEVHCSVLAVKPPDFQSPVSL